MDDGYLQDCKNILAAQNRADNIEASCRQVAQWMDDYQAEFDKVCPNTNNDSERMICQQATSEAIFAVAMQEVLGAPIWRDITLQQASLCYDSSYTQLVPCEAPLLKNTPTR